MNRRSIFRGLAVLGGSLGCFVTLCSMEGTRADEPRPSGARVLELPGNSSGQGPARLGPLTFDPRGERIVAGMESRGTVRVWDAASGRVLDTLQAHGQGIQRIAVSPDGRRVAVAGPAETIVIDRGIGEAFREVGAAIKVWDLDTRELVAEIEPSEWVQSVAFQAGGSSVLYVSRAGLTRWDIDTNGMKSWPFPEGVRQVDADDQFTVEGSTYDLSGNRIAAIPYRWDNNFRNALPGPYLWTLPAGLSRMLDLHERLGGANKPIALSPDGRLLALGTMSGTDKQRVEGWHRAVAILDFATGETLNRQRMPVLEPYCEVLEFSPDGTWLASASNPDPQKEPDVVRIWHVASGREMTAARCPVEREPREAQARQAKVRAMTFLEDGRLRVVSGGGLWTPEDKAEGVPIPLVVWEIDAPELP